MEECLISQEDPDPSSESPGRIRISAFQPPQPPQQPPDQMGPIAHELFRFRVKCMNGETQTSPYIYARLAARNAAREYCSTRGGVDGIIE